MEMKDLKTLNYQKLEEESELVLKELSDNSLSLDESYKIYLYGKEIYAEMESRLEKLSQEVKAKTDEN